MRKIKRYLAFILVVVLVLNIPIYGDATKKSVKATTTANITEDFEVTSLSELKGGFWGNPTKEIVNDAHGGNTALKLSKREADWNVYAYSISAYVGKTISIEAYMKVNASELIGAVVVKSTQGETTNYDWAASANLTSGAWTKLSGVYTVPIGATDLYFVTHKTAGTTDDYLLDDIKITVIPSIKEDFEKDSDTSTILGSTMGNPNLAIESGSPISGSKSLSVTNREANYYGYSYDLAAFAGNTIQLSAKVNTFETTAVNDVKATLAVTLSKDEYLTVASASVSGSAITVLETSAFDVPSGGKNYKLYFETAEKVSYMIDDVSITVVGTYKDPNEKTDGAIAPSIVENFNDYTDVSSKKGGSMGSPQFSLMTTDSPTGSNALLVTGRTSGYFGYSYNLSKFAGNTISISAKMCAFEATEADKNTMNITLAASKDGEVIGFLVHAEEIEVIEIKDGWASFLANDKINYVSSDFVVAERPDYLTPPPPTPTTAATPTPKPTPENSTPEDTTSEGTTPEVTTPEDTAPVIDDEVKPDI